MKLDKENYSKDEVTKILEDCNKKVEDYTNKLNEANTKLIDVDKQKETIQNLTKSNLENSIKVQILKNGLNEDEFDLVADSKDLETAAQKISKLVELKKKNIINNSYKPTEHNTTNEAYSNAKKKGNVQGMIKAKMSKLFS